MADETVQTQIQEGVRQLLTLSDADLKMELGLRLAQTQGEMSFRGGLTAAEPNAMPLDREKLKAFPDVAQQIGNRFLKNFNRQMYSLCCDDADPDHAKIRDAAASGAERLGYVLGGVFVGTFGWLPGIATVLAVIVAKRFAGSAYDAVCTTWKEQL